MLSRVASSLYWMSRYLERADNTARFIGVNLHLILDAQLDEKNAMWWPLIEATADEKDFQERYGEATEQNVIQFLTFDVENPNSIYSSLAKARENARSVREVISTEMWEQINALYHWLSSHRVKRKARVLEKFYKTFKNMNHLFLGIADHTMTHGQEWHFVRLGRFLERADKTARILGVNLSKLLPQDQNLTGYGSIEWAAVLRSADAYNMYRKRFHRVVSSHAIDFLLFDPDFPRSFTFCVRKGLESLESIADHIQFCTPAHLGIRKLFEMIGQMDVQQVLSSGLEDFVDRLQVQLNDIDDSIQRSFFGFQPENSMRIESQSLMREA